MVRASACVLGLALFIFLSGCASSQPRGQVVAHRGASWYLPEHTLEAYAMAYALGADLVEPDLVLTRDGVPICAHDLRMESVCNVAQVYPDRARADGRWYWIDFDLAEVKALRRYGRKEAPTPGYDLCTLEELLVMLDRLNTRTGRVVGLYPELKNPDFHTKEGRDFGAIVAGVLARHGYTRRDDAAIIQCFSLETLERLRDNGCDLRLAWAGQKSPPSDAVLARAARSVDILILNRNLVEDEQQKATELVHRAKQMGFTIHSATFDSEPAAAQRFLKTHQVEAVFCNDPAIWTAR